MNKYLTYIFIAFTVWGGKALAQDAHLSMFYASPVTLNPGMTGMFGEGYRGHIHYRNQWKSVLNSNPYSSMVASYDQQFKEQIGIGGAIVNIRVGIG